MENFNSYPKPDKFLGKRTDENHSEITPVYRTSDMEEIASGNFGKVHRTTGYTEDGTKVEFANKQNIEINIGVGIDYFTPEKIQKDLEIHHLLQQAGIPTFEQFYTDGKSLYSEFLNNEDEIAISPSDKKSRFRNMEISIDNTHWETIEKEIDNILEIATQNNIKLPWDCFFVIVSKSSKPPRVIVGDFDLIQIDHGLDPNQLSIHNDNCALAAIRQLRNRL